MRAGVFAVLLASTLLMRNEVVIALMVWAAAWIVYEVRARRQGTPTAPRKLLGAVGIPLLVIAAVMGGVAASSLRGDFVQPVQRACSAQHLPGVRRRISAAARGLQGQPVHGRSDLMERDFGKPMPSMLDAIDANPGAIGAHYLWNARLLPYGLQLMLFDRISAGGRTAIPITCRSRSSQRRPSSPPS